jgi:hypothetical protein
VEPEATAGITQVGHRVAILAEPGARYALAEQSATRTRIELLEGALTARLFHDEPASGAPDPRHDLELWAGDSRVTATGTIFTVATRPGREVEVYVHDGRVEVTTDGHTTEVSGDTGPAIPPGLAAAAARLSRFELTALRQRAPDRPQPEAPAAEPEAPVAADAAPEPPRAASPPSRADAAVSAKEPNQLWRRARLERAQGRPQAALRTLEELEGTGDPTWAPLALIEQMRIHGADLPQPAAVVTAGERFFGRHREHSLQKEVVELYCAAQEELTRTSPRCLKSGGSGRDTP